MKNIFFSFLAIALFANFSIAQNLKWSSDKSHSNVNFTVDHLVISEVDGHFSDYTVNAETNAKNELLKVEAVIKTGSVNTDNKDRDAHLSGDDFFNSEKFPEMKFVSKSIKKSGKGYKITGDLTIRDVTKTVTLDANFRGVTKDPWGNTKMGWNATTTINRFDYGLKWDKALETGGLVVGKNVKITLKIQYILNK